MHCLREDAGMQDSLITSPQMCRECVKLLTKSGVGTARTVNPGVHIAQHHSGYVEPIMDDLVELGLEALHPLQRESMDPRELKQRFGDVLALWGTVGAQPFMPLDTPSWRVNPSKSEF